MEFSWRGVDIEVPNNNKRYKQSRIKLVTDASGLVESGLLAVMGPSGSGKTTLMNATVGRVPSGSKTTGQILLNGSERTSIKDWLDTIGYVDQDDTIFEELTARETVKYAGKFRLKDSSGDINSKIDSLFQKLAISHVIKNKMKNLSGGERKRVMIAVELITNPRIIFLDEPTSGLDNNTALKIIKLLKELSNEGRTIIFTIHQPDDITADYFDQLLLLSQGRSVYMGKYKDCENYFVENGIKKEPKETFSNFAMRVLDVEPGVYYENQENTVIDKLVKDVKARYNTEEFIKRPRTSNDVFTNYSFSIADTLLIYKRKLKTRLLNFKNLMVFASIFLIQGFLVWNINSYIKYQKWGDKEIDFLYDETQKNFTSLKESKDTFKEIIHIIENCRLRFEVQTIFFVIAIAVIPVSASMTFFPELPQIRREIGVNTFSTTSYYIATILYEISNSAISLISNFVCFYFILGMGYGLVDYLPFLILYFIGLMIYLFIGSISTGPKIANVLASAINMLMFMPYVLIITGLKIADVLGNDSKISIFLNFLPPFSFNIFLIKFATMRFNNSSYSQIKSVLKKSNVDHVIEKLRSLRSFNVLSMKFMMDEDLQRKTLTGFNLSRWLSIPFLVVVLSIYIFLSVIILGKRLGPGLRMMLNSK